MTDLNISLDPSVLAEFIDESEDMLAGLDALFVQLEQNPDDMSPVQAIFRPVHSIKGNAAFFGFMQVKALAHELETLLDQVRKGIQPATGGLITVLLAGLDELKAMFERVRLGQDEVDDEPHFQQLLAEVQQAATGQVVSDEKRWGQLFAELDQLEQACAAVSDTLKRQVAAVIQSARALAPAVEPAASGQDQSQQPAEVSALRALIDMAVTGGLDEDQSVEVGNLLKQLQALAGDSHTTEKLEEAINSYDAFVGSATGFDPLLAEMLDEILTDLATRGVWACADADADDQHDTTPNDPPASDATTQPTQAPPHQADKQPATTPPTPSAEKTEPDSTAEKHTGSDKTMRVSERHIDSFLEFVGELLVVGDMFEHLHLRMAGGESSEVVLPDFRRSLETFNTLSNGLQQSIMSVRRVPARALCQKVPRLVRDIAIHAGKQIDVQIIGDDVTIDKSLIDLLDAPLVHIVRNAADHGIENPEKRLAAGKPAEGKIRVMVAEQDNSIVLQVTDDGAGLNYQAIRQKAESMGMVQPGQPMAEQEVVELLFSSGVSTAEQVTDVSGRGVGMDVVRRQIRDAGGEINVQSVAGQGSTFTVRLPKSVSTQIMPGYMISVGRNRYVLPMNRVRQTASVAQTSIKTVTGKGRCISRHGELLPIVALHEVLGVQLQQAMLDREYGIFVSITTNNGRRYALEVDEVLGVQQVVVRPMNGIDLVSDLYSGAALLGNGSVALIVDVDNLLLLGANQVGSLEPTSESDPAS